MPHGLEVLLGVLFDGVAYGALLFLIGIGLSVTLGLMNFVNLAHGALAMAGGYLCVTLMTAAGLPFLLTLPLVFLGVALVGAGLERTLLRRLYGAGPLEQVLFTIGLTLMAISAATFRYGPGEQPVRLPAGLRGQVHLLGLDLGAYRLFLLALVVALAGALHLLVTRTRFGAQLRAAVDHRTAAAGLGIPVDRVLTLTFALGAGLAGLGGALGIDVLGLDPTFPLKYLVYFLLVVAVGGAGGVRGPALAALLLGVVDVAGKYYVPWAGAFAIYAAMLVLLALYPAGLEPRRA
jgi:branched-chain amino acid transport system permease protein